MLIRRRTERFNLAFLDIMACGLGAVALVFMLVKHTIDRSQQETDLLTTDITRLEDQKRELSRAVKTLRDVSTSEDNRIILLKDNISTLKATLDGLKKTAARKRAQVADLKSVIQNTPRARKEDLVRDDRGGEENYLMGLKVEGKRIAIMIDSSASMTDETLLAIIRRKNGSDTDKQKGPKWLRTKKIVRWLLARIPAQSQVLLVSYNHKAKTVGAAGWHRLLSTDSLQRLYGAVDKIVPTGATNLQKGLDIVSAMKPTDVYVITDGLPTEGESTYRSLNPFAACSSLRGSAKTISGECRVKLFRQTIQDSAPSGSKINVILLPIEGDPDAANEYWAWTSPLGGLLISPAANWP